MSWGSKKTDETTAADKVADSRDNRPKTDETGTKASDTAPDVPPPETPAKQAPLLPNRENAHEADQQVNPHNEALGQRPIVDAEQKLNEAEEWFRTTHVGRLAEWKRRVFLGGPKGADWEEFDSLIDEGKKDVSQRRAATSKSATAETIDAAAAKKSSR